MTTTFRKGQQVTLLQSWDGNGTIRITNLTVFSCGQKQMILVDAAGDKFEGRHFQPIVMQGEGYLFEGAVSRCQVHPLLTHDDAERLALELGARVVAEEKAQCELKIARAEAERVGNWQAYVNAVKTSVAKLHTPDVLWYSKK